MSLRVFLIVLAGCITIMPIASASELRINQIQFVGSHNSYKLAMSSEHFQALRERNPKAALSLEYHHPPLTKQLNMGLRKLELDIFNTTNFTVGHVQEIDMNSSCSPLADCFTEIITWSNANSTHEPIWVSFNAKDAKIPGLPDPTPFDVDAFNRLDQQIEQYFASRLIRPRDVKRKSDNTPIWPYLHDSRGKFLFILDEGAEKRRIYEASWRDRPMFTTNDERAESAAILIINDPIEHQKRIRQLVAKGFMVRTRSDADTVEARRNDVTRRDLAFESGAQAISTDYYERTNPFDTNYRVHFGDPIRCNPISAPKDCQVPHE